MLLDDVEVDQDKGIFSIGYDTIDILETYCANCKDSPSKEVAIVPGFGNVAIRNDPVAALNRFVNFCKSQHGQRMKDGLPFTVVLHKKTKPIATLASVDLCNCNLTYYMLSGAEVSISFTMFDALGCTVGDLALSVDLVTSEGLHSSYAQISLKSVSQKKNIII